MRCQNRLRNMRKLNFILIIILSSAVIGTAFSHSGRTDSQGGHNDRKRGGYHCHSEPCFSIHKKSKEALEEAVREKRQFSHIYNRDEWEHWSDFDGDCMNTRHEVLNNQAEYGTVKHSPDGCYVSRGRWLDPFSGEIYTRASDLDVDHVIPLKWAHTHGGANWSKEKKEMFANDQENLLAVDDSLNQQKGAKGTDLWMPPNEGFWCGYLQIWNRVLTKYPDLKMVKSEETDFRRMLNTCNITYLRTN